MDYCIILRLTYIHTPIVCPSVFADPVFLMTPDLDARFKLFWRDNLLPGVKARVVDKIDVFVSHFSARTTVSVPHTYIAQDQITNEQGATDIAANINTMPNRH